MNQKSNKIISMMKDKKILIIGLGREGKSTLDFLVRNKCTDKIYLTDKNPEVLSKFKNIYKCFVCEEYFKIGESFDYIFRSPGINPKFIKTDGKVISQTILATQIFSEKIIGVTGTKGKSTTSSIINFLLNKLKYKSILVGNIGNPFLDSIEEDAEYIVYEMSSHQLIDSEASPKIAVLLNVYPEHLDYYNDYNQYYEAKVNIARFQKEDSTLIYCADSKEAVLASKTNKSNIKVSYSIYKKADIYYDNDFIYIFNKRIKYRNNFNLIGEHNVSNLLAALAVLYILGIDINNKTLKTLSDFKGLPHRLEYSGYHDNIHFYNDSISTIPETAIMAIKSFKEVDTIILGGYNRGVSYKGLVEFLIKEKINNIILISETGLVIEKLLLDNEYNDSHIYFEESLKQAVSIAKVITKKEGVCLFSPAAASFNTYKNFEQRGQAFKEYISALEEKDD